MEATSFCAGVRHKRYSGQLEIASDQYQKAISKINGNDNIKNGMSKSKSILKKSQFLKFQFVLELNYHKKSFEP